MINYDELYLRFKLQFLELISIAKQMKKQIVTFQDGRILGVDETFTSLSIIYYDNEKYDLFKEDLYKGLSLTFVLNELIAFLKNNDLSSSQYYIDQYGIHQISTNRCFENRFVFEKEIMNMDTRCKYYMSISNHTIVDHNIRQDQCFNSILELKKKDGSTMYNLDNRYLMSTFSSIHPVTKTDKMFVDIFELPDKRSFLSKFKITKKTCVIEEFIRYRFL